MRPSWKKLTHHETVERVVFLLAIIVLLFDVFIWRP
jgi:hypothetical protein